MLCNCLLSLETTSLLALKNHLPNDSYDMKNTGLWACLSGPYWHTRVLRVDDAVNCELDGTWNSWGVWAVGEIILIALIELSRLFHSGDIS